MENNGHTKIKGINLSNEQIELLKLNFKGMDNLEFIKCHSFWFKDGLPATENSGYYYPNIDSWNFLPY